MPISRRLFAPLAAVGIALLSGCSDDTSLAIPDGACRGNAKRYDAIERGEELCDSQHLVASIAPNRMDAKAGKGALRVPLRITREETRDYCFGDDNTEYHTLSLKTSSGVELLALTAGAACVTLALPPDVYDLRIQHATVGQDDATSDTIHTHLRDVSGRPTLTFESNGCPGCDLGDVGMWPCRSDISRGAQYCGFHGDYRNARIGGSCQNDPDEFWPIGFRPSLPTVCVLDGDFTGADLTKASIDYPGTDPFDRSVRQALQLLGSFGGVRFPARLQTMALLDVYVDATQLSGIPADLAGWDVYNVGHLTVDYAYAVALNSVHSFAGNAAVHHGNSGFAGRTFDFAKVELRPWAFAGVDLRGSTLRNIKSNGNAVSYANVRFDGATIERSVVDVTDLSGANFNDARLTDVTFQGGGATVPARLFMSGATLTNVRFGNAKVAASAVGFDLSDTTFDRSALNGVTFTNAKLTNTVWRNGTQIDGFSALGSDLTDASFDVTKFDNVDLSYSSVSLKSLVVKSSTAPTFTGLVARSTYLKGTFANATFKFCNFEDATLDGNFTGAHFSNSNLNRAFLTCVGAAGCTTAFFDRAIFDEHTTLNSAYFLASTTNARFNNVSASGATFRANLSGSIFNDASLYQAHFCLPSLNVSSPYAGMTFTNLSLADVVLPLAQTSVPPPPLPAGQEACFGAITAAERDSLATANVSFCPNGAHLATDCKGTDWDVPPGRVTPVCCVPKFTDPSCKRNLPGGPCAIDCDCASLLCAASRTCL